MAASCLLLCCCLSASADRRFFAYTYDWFTPAKGEKEIEFGWTQPEGGDSALQLEFEYGLTDQWMIAPYALFEGEGDEFGQKGWKIESRYRFSEFDTGKLLPAIYFEVKKENDEEAEVEAKLITTVMTMRGLVWSANLIAETALQGDRATAWEYSTGVAQLVGRTLRLGFEFKGEIGGRSHKLGPSFSYGLTANQSLIGTALYNYGEAARHEMRVLYEYEF